MRSVLITGSNRGLGLGLVSHLARAAKPPEKIFATCRDAQRAPELSALAQKFDNVHIIQLDLKDTSSYKDAVETVARNVGDAGLNVLFNNAGISSKFTRLSFVKETQLTEAFFVNTVAPILFTKAFLPLLKKAADSSGQSGGMSVNRAAVINMSSILGSIGSNDHGGFYPYRCSKSALNAATKSMSLDLKNEGILVTCMHPGWVKTDLGGSNAPLDVDTSVSGILSTMQTLDEKNTGQFLQYDGKTLPW